MDLRRSSGVGSVYNETLICARRLHSPLNPLYHGSKDIPSRLQSSIRTVLHSDFKTTIIKFTSYTMSAALASRSTTSFLRSFARSALSNVREALREKHPTDLKSKIYLPHAHDNFVLVNRVWRTASLYVVKTSVLVDGVVLNMYIVLCPLAQ